MQKLLTAEELQALLGMAGGPGGLAGNAATAPLGAANMEVILDVPVTLSIELGRSHMSIRRLMNLGEQALIDIDGPARSQLDIYANGVLIAEGELAAASNGAQAVRVTRVLGPDERARALVRRAG